jgi:O-antigen/teichoic acid export membrane protein
MLSPEDFGLSAIVFAVVTGLAAITDVGTAPALIRTHRNDADWLDTAWTLTVLRGTVLALIIMAAAIPASRFFEDPRLAPLIAFAAMTSLIQGWGSIRSITALRDLQLRAFALLEISAAIIGYVVILTWAWLSPSAWALIAGAISTDMIFAVGSYIAFGWRPIRFCWNRQAVAELTGFGKWVLLASIIGFLIFQGDKFGVAKLVGVSAVGLYAIASTWAMSLQTVFGIFLGQLYLPVSAKVWRKYGSGSPEFLALRRSVLWIMIVPCAAVAGCSDAIIAYLYPNIYAGAGPILTILVIGSWFSTQESLYHDQLMVAGEPRWRFYAQLVSLGVVAFSLLAMGRGITVEQIALIFSAGALVRAAFLLCSSDRTALGNMVPDISVTIAFVALTCAIKGASIEFEGSISPVLALIVCAIVAAPPAGWLTFKAMKRIFRLTDGAIA